MLREVAEFELSTKPGIAMLLYTWLVAEVPANISRLSADISFKITGHNARHHATLPARQVNVERLTALHKRAA